MSMNVPEKNDVVKLRRRTEPLALSTWEDDTDCSTSSEDAPVYYYKKVRKRGKFDARASSLLPVGNKRRRIEVDVDVLEENRILKCHKEELQKQVLNLQKEKAELKQRLAKMHDFVETLTRLPRKVSELLEMAIGTRNGLGQGTKQQSVCGDMVEIWNGKFIKKQQYSQLMERKHSLSRFTNTLLGILHSPAVLANSSWSGKITPAKHQLPDLLETVEFIAGHTNNDIKDVKLAIKMLLKTESRKELCGMMVHSDDSSHGNPQGRQEPRGLPESVNDKISPSETDPNSNKEGMVKLWDGKYIEKDKHDSLIYVKGNLRAFTYTLLRILHTRPVLANSSVSGKTCNAKKDIPAKPQLPDLYPTIDYIALETRHYVKDVKEAIRTLLNTESKKHGCNGKLSTEAPHHEELLEDTEKIVQVHDQVQSYCGEMVEIWSCRFIEKWKHDALMKKKEDMRCFADTLLRMLHKCDGSANASTLSEHDMKQGLARGFSDSSDMEDAINYIAKETNHDSEDVRKTVKQLLANEVIESQEEKNCAQLEVLINCGEMTPNDYCPESDAAGPYGQPEMVEIWKGRFIEKSRHVALQKNRTEVRRFTNLLLRTLHSRFILASSSLSGRAFTAHIRKGVVAKPQLPDVDAIIQYVANETKEDVRTVKEAIRTLLNTESSKASSRRKSSTTNDIPVVKELVEWDDEAIQACEMAQQLRVKELEDGLTQTLQKNFQADSVEMVEIWCGKFISKREHQALLYKRTSLGTFTNALLRFLYEPAVLANSSISGRVSNAHALLPPKPRLPDIDFIIGYIMEVTGNNVRDVKVAISSLLNTEAKAERKTTLLP